MANDGKVVIELQGKDNATQTFIKSMQDMAGSIKNLENSGKGLGSLGSAFGSIKTQWLALAGVIGGGYVISQGISKFWASFKENVEAEKALLRISDRLGTTVEEMSGLQYAAKKSGVDLDTFVASVTRLTKNISAANLGIEQSTDEFGEYTNAAGKATQALRELGFVKPEQIAALNNLLPKEKLMAISEAMKKIPSEADKVRIAIDLIGKSGAGLLPMFNKGAAGIQEMIDRGTKMGVILDKEMAQKGAAASSALKDLQDITQGFSLTMTDLAAPAVTKFVGYLNQKLVALRETDPQLQKFTTSVKEFAESWSGPGMEALIGGLIGSRIAGLQGAALGAAAGFMGLTTSLRELSKAMNDPMVLMLWGGALGSRLGLVGAAAGALGGATIGITRGIQKDAAANQKAQAEASVKGVIEDMPIPPQGVEQTEAAMRYQNSLEKINKLFGTGTRDKPTGSGGGGGGGKGGGGDSEAQRLLSLFDTLNKDIAGLGEGKFAAIEANLSKTLDQIYKKQEVRAISEAEVEVLARKKAALEKQKVEDEFWLGMAKESGNVFLALQKEYDKDLKAVQGVTGAKEALTEAYNRKRVVAEINLFSELTGLQKTYLDTMGSLSPLLVDQLSYKEKSLSLENQLAQAAILKTIEEKQYLGHLKEELLTQQSLVNQAKKYALEREKWQTQGTVGGMKMGLQDAQNTAATWQANMIASTLKSIPQDLAGGMATAFMDKLQNKKTDFESMARSMAESFIKKQLEGFITQIMPKALEGLMTLLGIETTTKQTASQTAAATLEAGGIACGAAILAAANQAASVLSGGGMTPGNNGLGQVGVSLFSSLFGGGGGMISPGVNSGGMVGVPGMFARGGVFQRFANGGVFHSPRIFPMADGYGLMAEAGPEAVMPLTRLPGGDLGVKAAGGGNQINITVNNNAPDTQARAETQANGDIIITIDDLAAKAYARRGSLHKLINSDRGPIRR